MASMTKKNQGDRAARRAEVHARMVAAMERLLEEGGSFTELSVERLAEEAGISRSTFYTYFEDKGHLLREITAEIIGQLGGIAREWWERAEDVERDELKAIVLRLFQHYRQHYTLLAAVADTSIHDPAVRETYEGMADLFISELTTMIARRQKAGSISADVPAKQVAQFLVWMHERTAYHEARVATPKRIERLAEANTLIVWNVIYPGR
jgi:TetR/AcrR family transcriptional regulator, ethionamide resistance regulator